MTTSNGSVGTVLYCTVYLGHGKAKRSDTDYPFAKLPRLHGATVAELGLVGAIKVQQSDTVDQVEQTRPYPGFDCSSPVVLARQLSSPCTSFSLSPHTGLCCAVQCGAVLCDISTDSRTRVWLCRVRFLWLACSLACCSTVLYCTVGCLCKSTCICSIWASTVQLNTVHLRRHSTSASASASASASTYSPPPTLWFESTHLLAPRLPSSPSTSSVKFQIAVQYCTAAVPHWHRILYRHVLLELAFPPLCRWYSAFLQSLIQEFAQLHCAASRVRYCTGLRFTTSLPSRIRCSSVHLVCVVQPPNPHPFMW